MTDRSHIRRVAEISFESTTTGFQLRSKFWVPRRPAEVFNFFADAGNLEALTPPWVHFQILTEGSIRMEVGAEIEYRLRLRGVPVRWLSRITAWRPNTKFVDEQINGPYRRWIHEHKFEELNGGTLAIDQVSYSVLGGGLVNRFLVAPDLRRIFEYRSIELIRIFGQPSETIGETE